MSKRILPIAFCLVFSVVVFAQDPAIGQPPYGSFEIGTLDAVNRANMNVNFTIPIVQRPGRGIDFGYSSAYDSLFWQKSGTSWTPLVDLAGNPTWGWKTDAPFGSAAWGYSSSTTKCFDDLGWYWGSRSTWSGYRYRDPGGTSHSFSASYTVLCGEESGSSTGTATDGSGYSIDISSTLSAGITGYPTVIAPDGTKLTGSNPTDGFTQKTDTNGNFISKVIVNSTTTDWVDTLGRTALEIVKNPTNIQYKTVDATGTTQTTTLGLTSYNIKTNFACTGVTDYTGTANLPTSLTLADGSSYAFTYEDTPSFPGYKTGRLKKTQLPTGGYFQYDYTGTHGGVDCTSGLVNGLDRTVNDGTTSNVWHFTGTATLTTEQDPLGNFSTYDYTNGPVGSIKIYAGAVLPANLKQTTDITYTTTTPKTPTSYTTTTDAGLKSKIVTAFDIYGNQTELDEYAWGSGGSPGALMRKKTITYLSSGTYPGKNIRNRPTDILITDPSGTKVAETAVTYDGTVPSNISSVVHHDDTNYGTGNNVRGNPTQVQQWVSGTTFLVNNATYDTTGQPLSISDTNGNLTTLIYANNFYLDASPVANPPATYSAGLTNAYPTTITSPMASVGSSTSGYYFHTGQLAVSTDPNAKASYLHYLDPLERNTHSFGPPTPPGRAWSILNYTSATSTDSYVTVDASSASTGCSSCIKGRVALDGLGRPVHKYLLNDPDGASQKDISYDAVRRTLTQSNPYRPTAPTTTDGTTTFEYDVLNRLTGRVNQDSSDRDTFYSADVANHGGIAAQLCPAATYGLGYPMLETDEAYMKKETWRDALGRVIEVDEPDASNTLTINTCYKFDLNDNLIQVVQGAAPNTRQRDFAYDGLSRMTSSLTPEIGAGGTRYVTNFYYTTSGGALCAGDPEALCRKTETGRNITTTYTYDQLGRLTGKSYSDSTPSVSYFYDQTSYNGLAIANGKGRQTGMTDSSAQPVTVAWNYDGSGNVLNERRTIAGVTKTTTYTYRVSGRLASVTYPISGRILTYSYSNVGRLLSVVDNANGINYATSAHYFPGGELQSLLKGFSGTFAGINQTWSYSNRRVITGTDAGDSIFKLGFDFGPPATNDTMILASNNLRTGQSNRSAAYQYDYIGRIKQANTSSSTLWGNTYLFDQWGNLLQKNFLSGYSGGETPITVTANTNNQDIQATNLQYNNDGTMSYNNPQSFTWNAEEMLKSAGGVTYTYDGNNLRVAKSNGKLYWRGVAGLSTSDASGNLLDEYIDFNDLPIARRNVSGSVYYQFQDQVQSTRVVTDATGNKCYDADYYPFGQESNFVNICPPEFKFGTYERDSESGLDYAMSRYYSPALGRFISPDMAEFGLTLPQSLNRYGYAGGDPIDLRDPNGDVAECDGLGGPGHPTGGGGDLGGGGGSPPFNPSGKPPLSEETLGIPRGLKFYQPFSLGGLLLGPKAYPGCDFGVCGSGFFQQKDPNSFHYGHWCGPGGEGTHIDDLDALCHVHDLAYDKIGVDYTSVANENKWKQLRPEQQKEIQNANQALCDGMAKLKISKWKEFRKWGAREEMHDQFYYHGPKDARCH